MRISLVGISILLCLLIGCTISHEKVTPGDIILLNQSTNDSLPPSLLPLVSTPTLPSSKVNLYPSFVEGCDRFRPIFEQELFKYPTLKNVFDLPAIYSLAYHESLCRTSDELKIYFADKGIHDDGWKGGIMQVDGCWRWGSLFDCSTIQKEIEVGVSQINVSYSKIDDTLNRYALQNISAREKLMLFFIAYNRGYYVSNEAVEIYTHKVSDNNFIISPYTIIQNGSLFVYVNCTEKDLCPKDYYYINIEDELQNYSTDLEKSLLISCRKNYGFMKNEQGDYCTGPAYGLNYPTPILAIQDSIRNYTTTNRSDTIIPLKEKEFYIGEINFSGYDWLIKDSIGTTGPGNNLFYYNSSSVFTDEHGYLHLRIIEQNGSKYMSEVVLNQNLGYGDYSFYLNGNFSNYDPYTVLGLFTYDLTLNSSQGYFHREMDYEMTRWGYSNNNNSQFVVQGPDAFSTTSRFNTSFADDIIILISWHPTIIHFEMRADNSSRDLLHEWDYTGELIPTPGNENIRINLWANNISQVHESEIVIKRFTFSKYS